jgi:nitrite reductase/ring-hydroxylating ferredoxin subunit
MPDLPENRATVVSVDDRCIMLCRTARGIRAADGFCPHQRKTLADARVSIVRTFGTTRGVN